MSGPQKIQTFRVYDPSSVWENTLVQCYVLISGHPEGVGDPREHPVICTTTFTNPPYPKPRLFNQKLLTPLPWGQRSVLCKVKRCNISRVLFAIINFLYIINIYRYLQIPWVFPRGYCYESKKAIQSPHHARVKYRTKLLTTPLPPSPQPGWPPPRDHKNDRSAPRMSQCSGWKHEN